MYQSHREKVKWIRLLVNVHIHFPAYAEALHVIHEHYGDFHDKLAGFTEGMNGDREKHDRERVPRIPRLRVVDPASMQLPVAPHLFTRRRRDPNAGLQPRYSIVL